jgi:hypothetical protein
MRGEFRGGVCDGHSHPVGREPLPEVLAAPCTLGAGVAVGHYVLAGVHKVDQRSSSEVAIYEWEPDSSHGSTSRPAE